MEERKVGGVEGRGEGYEKEGEREGSEAKGWEGKRK